MNIQRKLRTVWDWYSFAAGLFLISVVVGYSILIGLSDDGPVMTMRGEVRNVSKTVPVGGTVRYTFDATRHASCPGYVVTNLMSRTNHGPPAVVTFRRPLRSIEIKDFDNIHAEVVLPESVFAGRWSLQSSIDSRCPTQERSDVLAMFEFEVVPK